MQPSEKRIYRLTAVSILLIAAAFVVPRFVPNMEGGFASAANAVLAFLVVLGVALCWSIYTLVATLRLYSSLPNACRLAGIAPSVCLAVGLLVLIGFLGY